MVERGWLVKQQGTRAVIVTDLGKQQLRDQFGVHVSLEGGSGNGSDLRK
jgi:hypothetical protein